MHKGAIIHHSLSGEGYVFLLLSFFFSFFLLLYSVAKIHQEILIELNRLNVKFGKNLNKKAPII
jgi:hypothetical protein